MDLILLSNLYASTEILIFANDANVNYYMGEERYSILVQGCLGNAFISTEIYGSSM